MVAYDPKTGKTSTQTVQHVFINHDTDLLDVTLKVSLPATGTAKAATRMTAAAKSSGTTRSAATVTKREETIHTTDTHPWLSADHGWLPASFLHLGEPVMRAEVHDGDGDGHSGGAGCDQHVGPHDQQPA